MLTLCATLALLLLASVQGKYKYVEELPNGHLVPHPCDSTKTWVASGHHSPDYESDKHTNQFGEDFHHHHKEWNSELCKMDSDRDGKTNGEELGDPSCIWSKHGNHNLPKPTGHPGICEPVGSPACASQGFSCATGFSHHHHH